MVNFASMLTITNTIFSGKQAIGGNSAVGPGAPAAGGGLAAEIFADTTLTDVSFLGNQAMGGSGGSSSPGYPGTGGAGSSGGNGSGGGVYVLGTTTASIDATLITFDAALGGCSGTGGASGQGSGGGLYIDTGAGVTLSKSSKVVFNFASTGDDDIFGVYT
ncbi:MAG: hypothetical protein ACLQVF_08325 [Isosphaeraceae bacterium]